MEDVVITGVGMVTSVGSNMAQSCSSIRAGINRFSETESYCPLMPNDWDDYEQLVYAPLSIIDSEQFDGKERMIEMACLATQDLIKNAEINRALLKETAFFIGLPSSDRGKAAEKMATTFLPDFLCRAGLTFNKYETFSTGHSSVYMAMERAQEMLANQKTRFCIVGGVDSFINDESLDWLDEAYRLKSERNKDGFIPGEGAAFFVMECLENAVERKANILGIVRGIGGGFEENAIFADKPNKSEGLSKAFIKAAETTADNSPIEWVVCDLNGESFRSKEWGIAFSRLGKLFGNVIQVEHPADCLGDTGAASGAVSIAVAARAFEREYAPRNKVLLWSSSDHGERSAVILEKYLTEE